MMEVQWAGADREAQRLHFRLYTIDRGVSFMHWQQTIPVLYYDR